MDQKLLELEIEQMGAVIEAAQAFIQSIALWLTEPMGKDIDPFVKKTYPTLPFNEQRFVALGRLQLALTSYEQAHPRTSPSDSELTDRIMEGIHTKWKNFTHIEGPALMPWVFQPHEGEVWRAWVAALYFDESMKYIGIRGWVHSSGRITITHVGQLKAKESIIG